MSNGARKKVKTVMVAFDDGTCRVYPDDEGYMPVALFWEKKDPGKDDVSGIDILGAYYDSLSPKRTTTYDTLEQNFSTTAAAAAAAVNPTKDPTKDPVTLTSAVIDKIWNTPCTSKMAVTPELPGIMSKDPGCDSRR